MLPFLQTTRNVPSAFCVIDATSETISSSLTAVDGEPSTQPYPATATRATKVEMLFIRTSERMALFILDSIRVVRRCGHADAVRPSARGRAPASIAVAHNLAVPVPRLRPGTRDHSRYDMVGAPSPFRIRGATNTSNFKLR